MKRRQTLERREAVHVVPGEKRAPARQDTYDRRAACNEGCVLPVTGLRDCTRQTALDLMQLVRAIRENMDLDGDGVRDLDGNRIYKLCGAPHNR